MTRLLRANFTRMFKGKTFRVCILILPVLRLLSLLPDLFSGYAFQRPLVALEENLFQNTTAAAVFLAVFAGLYLGTEHSNGGLRRKLSVGHTRTAVYLSNLLTCTAAGFLIFTALFSVNLAVGLMREYTRTLSWGGIALRVLICLSAIAALSSLLALIGTIFSGNPPPS